MFHPNKSPETQLVMFPIQLINQGEVTLLIIIAFDITRELFIKLMGRLFGVRQQSTVVASIDKTEPFKKIGED